MNKEQFLAAIRERLEGLPPGDLERTLEYYREMIEDRMEDGLTEEEAVQAIGPVDDIAAQILAETALPLLPIPAAEERRPSYGRKIGMAALLILGSPVWVPLLLAAGAIVLSLYIAAWSILLALYAVDLALAAGAVGGGMGAVVLLCTGHTVQALLFLGASLLCAGVSILLFFGSNQLVRWTVWLGKIAVLWVRSQFDRMRGAA